MQSLSRAMVFVVKTVALARANPAGLVPSVYAAAAGLGLGLVSLALTGVALHFGRGHPAALGLAGFLLCAMLLCQSAAAAIFSCLTAARISTQLESASLTTRLSQSNIKKQWLDLFFFSLARPWVWVASRLRPISRRPTTSETLVTVETATSAGTGSATGTAENGDASFSADPVEMEQEPPPPAADTPQKPGAQSVDRAWHTASYLVIPIMGIENLDIKASLQRAAQFVQTHSLRINAGQIGVRGLGWLAGGLLFILGLAAGWAIYHFTVQAHTAVSVHKTLITCLSLLVCDIFILAGMVFASYFNTVYATSLYLWSRNAERARQERLAEPVLAPGLLASALEK
jgi:hypothetical protein